MSPGTDTRELDLGYNEVAREREERRGLETRGAATLAAILTLAVVGIGGVTGLQKHRVPIHGMSSWFLGAAAVLAVLTVLLVALSFSTPTDPDLHGFQFWDRLGLKSATPKRDPRIVERTDTIEARLEARDLLDERVRSLSNLNRKKVRWLKRANVLLTLAAACLLVGLFLYQRLPTKQTGSHGPTTSAQQSSSQSQATSSAIRVAAELASTFGRGFLPSPKDGAQLLTTILTKAGVPLAATVAADIWKTYDTKHPPPLPPSTSDTHVTVKEVLPRRGPDRDDCRQSSLIPSQRRFIRCHP